MLSDLPAAIRCTVIQDTAGLHLFGTFGSAHSQNIFKREPFARSDWDDVGSWSVVTNLVGASDDADAIWLAWCNKTPLPPGIDLCRIDNMFGNFEQLAPTATPPVRPHQETWTSIACPAMPN